MPLTQSQLVPQAAASQQGVFELALKAIEG